MVGSAPLPNCKALLLCDQILVEAATGRTSLIGILDRIEVEGFPAELPRCQIFLQITDGFGAYDISVEVHHLENDENVFRAEAPRFDIDDRLASVKITIPLSGIELFGEGTYDVVVLFDNRELDRQSFRVEEFDEPEEYAP